MNGHLVMKSGMLMLALLLLPAVHAQAPVGLLGQANFVESPSAGAVRVSGRVMRADNSAAVNIELRFWQPDQAAIFRSTRTNQQGEYAIGLDDGLWLGAACGSETGYQPARWRINISDNAVTSLQAEQQSRLRLNSGLSSNPQIAATNTARQGDRVTISGSGFACSGVLRFVYRNQVSHVSGQTLPVEYGVADVVVDQFVVRTDTTLSFDMPALHNLSAHQHIAQLRYEQGGERSNALLFTQQMLAIIDDEVTSAGARIENEVSIDFSPTVVVHQGIDHAGRRVVTVGNGDSVGRVRGGMQNASSFGVEPVLDEPLEVDGLSTVGSVNSAVTNRVRNGVVRGLRQ